MTAADLAGDTALVGLAMIALFVAGLACLLAAFRMIIRDPDEFIADAVEQARREDEDFRRACAERRAREMRDRELKEARRWRDRRARGRAGLNRP